MVTAKFIVLRDADTVQSRTNVPNFRKNAPEAKQVLPTTGSCITVKKAVHITSHMEMKKRSEAGFEEMYNDDFPDSYFTPYIRP